jgi:hypothetical protein
MPWYIRLLRGVESSLYALFLAGILAGSSLLVSTEPSEAARRYTRSVEFDFVSWTLDAFGVKLGQATIGTPFYFTEPSRHEIVVEYLHLINSILTDENQLNLYYTDPQIHDPAADSAFLRSQLDSLYARQRQVAPLAESILQEQVSATLADLGITTGGQPLPPVMFHITPLPDNLIISPRDVIKQEASISLLPDLSVEEQVALENQVDSGMNVSSLVVPVGGLGAYPTMIMRTTNLNWLSDTIAHEWTHNWLTLRPLGLNYETTPELRTMNETTASIAGKEIGRLVLQRYYPELAANAQLSVIHWQSSVGSHQTTRPIALADFRLESFDFNAEMHTTRVQVDELLAQGKISEAEAYMEQRRQFFWQNGYGIRKLNQAYFAFYGAYADVPGGAAGQDPVGPAVRALRAQSPTLTAFLEKISQMDSFKQLQAAVAP